VETIDPAPQTGQYVQANGLNIYYETAGSGTPLVLIHGGTVNLSSWAPQMAAFSQHFRVIAFDSRGHGRTTNPDATLSYRLLADDTAALIQALALDRPLVCGYSDGGQVILELGVRYPGLAHGYVIGAATHRWPEGYVAWAKDLGMDGPGDVDLDRVEREHPGFVNRLRAQQDRFQGADYWKTYLPQLSHMWLGPLPFTPADFQQFDAPALIIVGDRDDAILPVEDAVALYRLIPQAELAIVPGVNHLLPWAKPELFTQLTLDFLLRQAGGGRNHAAHG
jgi:pimeloyl-ACP methyl ester carboxylesterase